VQYIAKAIDELKAQHPGLSFAEVIENLVIGDPKSGESKLEGIGAQDLFDYVFGKSEEGQTSEKKGVLDEGLGNMMLTLASIELPKEIVPLEALLGAIIDLILKLAKGNAKVKAAAFVADKTGIKDKYIKDLSAQLRSAGADPNRLWSEWLLGAISPKFTQL